MKGYKQAKAGWERIDVLVFFGVIILICIVSVYARRASKAKSITSKISCESRLDRIGIAFMGFANDHGGKYPASVPAADGGTREFSTSGIETYRHFQSFSNSLGLTEFLVCPADTRMPAVRWAEIANTNVSYFLGIDASSEAPDSILAGDRNISKNFETIMTLRDVEKWEEKIGLHGNQGHILLGDGRVRTILSAELKDIIETRSNSNCRVSIP